LESGRRPPVGNGNLEVIVEAAVRITPQLSQIVSGGRHVPVASVLLGGVPRGAVILLSAAGEPAVDVAEAMNRLAEHGYESVAADLGRVTAGGAGPGDDTAVSDVAALADLLAGRGWSREQIGLVGYGYGGRAALLAAASDAFGAAVSIEPAGAAQFAAEPRSVGDGRGLLTPWLGLFAEPGDAGRAAWLPALRRALWLSSPVYTQVVTYPGVSASYYRDSREAAAHAAAFDTWQRVVEWLNLRVVPRPTPLAEAWRARESTKETSYARRRQQ
jgi:carboxymethylenebutenolidase